MINPFIEPYPEIAGSIGFAWEVDFSANDHFEYLIPTYVEKLFSGGPFKGFIGTHLDDTFHLSSRNDRVLYLGDNGNDHVILKARLTAAIDGELGNDTLTASGELAWIRGGAGQDVILGRGNYFNSLSGGSGNDHITSENAQFSEMWGRSGSDTIHGGSGNDKVFGGSGDDYLSGGRGDDELSGDSGTDKFVFDESNWGRDEILDFQDGIDSILIFAATGAYQFDDLTITTYLNPATATGYQTTVRFIDQNNAGQINEIVLPNIQSNQLTEADFFFG